MIIFSYICAEEESPYQIRFARPANNMWTDQDERKIRRLKPVNRMEVSPKVSL
jgi:hypothetical protein